MLKYKDKKWYQFWQPESSKTNFHQKEKEVSLLMSLMCLGREHRREAHCWKLFFPRTARHCFTSVTWLYLRTHTRANWSIWCVLAVRWQPENLAGSYWQMKTMKGCWEVPVGYSLDHSCIKLSYAKRFCAVVSAISVDPMWGEAINQKS